MESRTQSVMEDRREGGGENKLETKEEKIKKSESKGKLS